MVNNTQNTGPQKHKHHNVHGSLAFSYIIYFIALLIGIMVSMMFPVRLFHASLMGTVGFLLIFIASILIIWAQLSTAPIFKRTEITIDHFYKGPYKYTRSPTHFGLFLAMLGFGFISNAFFVIIFAFIAYLITRFTFLKKQEEGLEKNFGEPYLKYKDKVQF